MTVTSLPSQLKATNVTKSLSAFFFCFSILFFVVSGSAFSAPCRAHSASTGRSYSSRRYCRPREPREATARYLTVNCSPFVAQHRLQWLTYRRMEDYAGDKSIIDTLHPDLVNHETGGSLIRSKCECTTLSAETFSQAERMYAYSGCTDNFVLAFVCLPLFVPRIR